MGGGVIANDPPTNELGLIDLKFSSVGRDFFSFLSFFFFAFFRAAPAVYGGSQARGLIRAVAAGLHQSHSNPGSELHLRPPPQLMATPDP